MFTIFMDTHLSTLCFSIWQWNCFTDAYSHLIETDEKIEFANRKENGNSTIWKWEIHFLQGTLFSSLSSGFVFSDLSIMIRIVLEQNRVSETQSFREVGVLPDATVVWLCIKYNLFLHQISAFSVRNKKARWKMLE